ncbi:hypothetical protein J4G02_21200, partial [Candidatus Poribacteria bacterium]|nr:hypothetical protein [Candidatus Poribacteria bacterium]
KIKLAKAICIPSMNTWVLDLKVFLIRHTIDRCISDIQVIARGKEAKLPSSIIENRKLGIGAGVGTALAGRKNITCFTDLPIAGTL